MRARYGAVRGGVLTDKSCRGDGGGLAIHNGLVSASTQVDIDILLDSYLYSIAADTNYGGESAFQVQKFMADIRAQAVMHVDLSVIPVGRTILSAVLWMRAESGGTSAIECHRLLVDYVEMQVTYNIRKTGVNWSAPGAVGGVDYVAAAGGIFTPVSSDYGSGDIITLIQDWYRDGDPNYGMLLRRTVASAGNAFNASDSPETWRHPFVRIVYS